MDEIVTQPLILQRKSRSSRFSNWSGDANSFRDKLFRSIYIFLLFVLDLVMFIYSINGRLLESSGVNTAVFVILGAVFAVSFVLIMLLSFSKDLQNLMCALFTMLITVAFFYQFGLGDVDNFLEIWFNKHASWLSFLCIVPSPWLVGFFFGLLIFIAFRFSDAILFITLVLLFSCVIGIEKNEILRKTNAEYQEIQELPVTAGEVSETSVVYLMLPKLPSYQFLNSIRDTNFRELRDLLIGFYAANDFEIYPNAFVKNGDTMSNIIDIINQVDYTSTTSANRGFIELANNWDFIHGGLDKYVLEYNQLYEYMAKQGYGVSTYAMPEFNFCVADSAFATDRCVIKGYKTVSLFDAKMPLEKNVFALLGEWLLSLKSRDMKPLAKMLINSSQLKNLKVISENRRVSLEGGATIFEKLSNDYKRDKGGQLYLAYVDLPSDIYIYDEFCNIKPRDKWVSLKDNTLVSGGIDEKRKAYADQAKCLVGKLQEYMEEISELRKITKTDIIIQGISPLRELAGVTGDIYSNFVADKLVNLAIRKGKKPKFLINANICLASDFTKTWLRTQDYCYTLDNMPNYSTEEVLNLKKNLINNSLIRGSRISNIVVTYKDWYETYKANSVSYQNKVKRKQEEELARKRRDEELQRQWEEENRIHKPISPQKSMSQNNENIFIPSEDEGGVATEDDIIEQNEEVSLDVSQQLTEPQEGAKQVEALGDEVSLPAADTVVNEEKAATSVFNPEIKTEETPKEESISEIKVENSEPLVPVTQQVESVAEKVVEEKIIEPNIEEVTKDVELPLSVEPVVSVEEKVDEITTPEVSAEEVVEPVVSVEEKVDEITMPEVSAEEVVEPIVESETGVDAVPEALTKPIELPDVEELPLPNDMNEVSSNTATDIGDIETDFK